MLKITPFLLNQLKILEITKKITAICTVYTNPPGDIDFYKRECLAFKNKVPVYRLLMVVSAVQLPINGGA